MSPHRIGLSAIAVCMAMLLASTGVAQDAAAAKVEPADTAKLVVGDWYEVTVEVDGVQESLHGVLVKVTDKWLVLGVACCVSSQVPRSPLIPHWTIEVFEPHLPQETLLKPVGEHFKRYEWVRRASATVTSRERNVHERVRKTFDGDSPKLDGACAYSFVKFVEKEQQRDDFCERLRLENGKLCLINSHSETVNDGNPIWSEVPILGYLFLKQRIVEREEITQVPLDKVIVACQSVPYSDLERRANAAGETKRK